jgi:hypothetical protein
MSASAVLHTDGYSDYTTAISSGKRKFSTAGTGVNLVYWNFTGAGGEMGINNSGSFMVNGSGSFGKALVTDGNANAVLDVNGNTIITGSITSTSNIEANSTQAGNWGHVKLSLDSGWAGGSYPTIGSAGGSSGTLIMLHNPHVPFRTDNAAGFDGGRSGMRCAINVAADNFWDIGLYGDAFHIYRNASSARFLVIDSGGNVGIGKGTSNPNSKLDVNGNTIISGSLIVTGDVQADYTPHFLLMGA